MWSVLELVLVLALRQLKDDLASLLGRCTACNYWHLMFFFLFLHGIHFLHQATAPSDLWVKDLGALGDVLDEIAEATRKQEIEDDRQRKNAGKRKVKGVLVGRV